jgi:hypothetical protein
LETKLATLQPPATPPETIGERCPKWDAASGKFADWNPVGKFEMAQPPATPPETSGERCECGAAVEFSGTTGYRAYKCDTKKWADGLISRSVECLEQQLAAVTERAEKAEADNAALSYVVCVLVGRFIDQPPNEMQIIVPKPTDEQYDEAMRIAAEYHPGGALLERVKKLENKLHEAAASLAVINGTADRDGPIFAMGDNLLRGIAEVLNAKYESA